MRSAELQGINSAPCLAAISSRGCLLEMFLRQQQQQQQQQQRRTSGTGMYGWPGGATGAGSRARLSSS